MKPKILLATKVPFHFQQFLKTQDELPPFQAQFFWLRALRKLGYPVELFLYNRNFLFSRRALWLVNQRLEANLPLFYEKIRLGLNRFYFFNPENYFRHLSFLRLVNQWQPDYLFLTAGVSELLLQSLRVAKKKGTRIIVFAGVSPRVSLTRLEKRALPLFDWVITNDPHHVREWQALGVKKAWCLPYAAIDSEFHRPLRAKGQQFSSEVCFVGTLTKDRQTKLIALHRAQPKIKLKIWGYVPPSIGLKKELETIYQGEAWGKKMVQIFSQTKIALNFVPKQMPVGGNMRTFEIPGCGAFQLVDRIDPAWFKIGKEVVVFKSLADLKKKLAYYLRHEPKRQTIARAGFRRAHHDHTYQRRFEQLIARLEREK